VLRATARRRWQVRWCLRGVDDPAAPPAAPAARIWRASLRRPTATDPTVQAYHRPRCAPSVGRASGGRCELGLGRPGGRDLLRSQHAADQPDRRQGRSACSGLGLCERLREPPVRDRCSARPPPVPRLPGILPQDPAPVEPPPRLPELRGGPEPPHPPGSPHPAPRTRELRPTDPVVPQPPCVTLSDQPEHPAVPIHQQRVTFHEAWGHPGRFRPDDLGLNHLPVPSEISRQQHNICGANRLAAQTSRHGAVGPGRFRQGSLHDARLTAAQASPGPFRNRAQPADTGIRPRSRVRTPPVRLRCDQVAASSLSALNVTCQRTVWGLCSQPCVGGWWRIRPCAPSCAAAATALGPAWETRFLPNAHTRGAAARACVRAPAQLGELAQQRAGTPVLACRDPVDRCCCGNRTST